MKLRLTLKHQRRFSKMVWRSLLLSVLVFAGCTFSFEKLEFDRAERAFQDKDYKEALSHYAKLVKSSAGSDYALKAARQGAQVAFYNTEEFQKAIDFNKYIILYSRDSEERRAAQKKIAAIYYEKLNDFKEAISAFNLLLSLNPTSHEEYNYKFSIAKAQHSLGQFEQAQTELSELLGRDLSTIEKFNVRLFLASVLISVKKPQEASKIYLQLIEEYPEFAKSEKVPLTLSVTYEEMDEFDKAIDILEKHRDDFNDPDYVDLKIKKLRQRRANQPLAKGYKR